MLMLIIYIIKNSVHVSLSYYTLRACIMERNL